MFSKSRIFLISNDTDGIESVFVSKNILGDLRVEHYFDKIVDTFSHRQAEDQEIHIGCKSVSFDERFDLTDFILKFHYAIDNYTTNIYDNIYIINQLDKATSIRVTDLIDLDKNKIDIKTTSIFNDDILKDGLIMPPKTVISMSLINKIKSKEDILSCKNTIRDFDYYISKADVLKEGDNMEDKYMNKLNSLNDEEKRAAKMYFAKRNAIEALFKIVRKSFDVKSSFGNYNSKVMCILDFKKLDDKILKLIKKFYEINGQDFYGIYITPYNKTDNRKINYGILKKEINFIRPQRIVSFGINNLKLGNNFMGMNKEDFDFFYDCVGNKDKVTGNRYLEKKKIFVQIVKFLITGKK